MQEVVFENQHFELLPEAAVFWKSKQVLIVADLHLGKSAHFRSKGFAIPQHADAADLEKLEKVINNKSARALWFLGDLFHSHKNSEWNTFVNWVQRQSIPMTLIKGNHDVIATDLFEALGIQVLKRKHEAGISFTHEPEEDNNTPNIAGHLHPGVAMQEKSLKKHKFSCFYWNNRQLIVPAFGGFTGKHIIKPNRKTDKVFIIANQQVIQYN
ncbi:MAG: ligase-associated DNA damage response endonuclease PdeM [Flavobacteriaceae bacterium]|nr:ligase-associated DNA damage response endonuclease PdeM [Flavobacteriaceae bacterium]